MESNIHKIVERSNKLDDLEDRVGMSLPLPPSSLDDEEVVTTSHSLSSSL